MAEFDGIIIGTGHNALILQAYLGRCGLKVLSLEQASVFGGGLNTVENPRVPGCYHNLHSFFHRGLTGMPWWRDFSLASYGVEYVEPDLNVAMITPTGKVLEWWRDFEKTVSSFAGFSIRDAERLRYWHDQFEPIVEEILIPEAQSPPIDPDLRRRLLQKTAMGRLLLEVSALTPLEFVMREFEDDAVRAGLLFFNGLREVDLRLKGFGHSIPALIAAQGKAQMCVGGSNRLASGLSRVIAESGGEIRCDVVPRQIRVENGKAVGVELDSGEIIRSKGFIVSGLNPQQTFSELLSDSSEFALLRERSTQYRYNLIAPLLGLHLVLEQAPSYAAAERYPELKEAFMTILGLEHVGQFPDLVEGHECGEMRSPIAWGANPTLFDPSQGNGKHTAFLWEKVPFNLQGSSLNWASQGQSRAADLLSLWQKAAPNLTEDNILDQFVVNPRDTLRTLPNMRDGDLLIGSFAGGQMGRNRPFYEAGRYRTPIEGLYLCSGATHPGGNITGLPGYNAAAVIAEDYQLNKWWVSRDFEVTLRALN